MKTPGPSLRGIWALLWRSTLLFPFALGLFILYCGALVVVFMLPVVAGISAWEDDWWSALLCAGGWLVSLACLRLIKKWDASDETSDRITF